MRSIILVCIFVLGIFTPVLVLATDDLLVPYDATDASDLSEPVSLSSLARKSRYVVLNDRLIDESAPSLSLGEKLLKIDLFAGKTVEFTNLKKSSLPSSGSILTAYVDGKMGDTITLIYRDGVITGNFTVDGQQYQLRFVGEQDGQALHVLHEIDPARYPQEHPSEFASGAVKPFNIQGARQDLSTDSAFDDGTSIDVMVVYTPAARLAAGGTTAMLNLIDLAVSETNAGYGNSGINTNLNLVNAHEVSYTETGSFYTDLSRLEGTSDGYIDGIHTIRDQVQADMVGMIIEDTQYCGLASAIMASASTAFQVTARTCATGYYSFAHEFGHLQGARHDWRVDPTNNSPFTYNHGYVKADQGWRTIMAYNDSGACSGGYCARLQYWSNPDVTYGAYPMGVSEGSTNAADNRKTLNQTAVTAANWRTANTGTNGDKDKSPSHRQYRQREQFSRT